jgi:endo-1,4-beta-mannosidase
MAELSEQFRLGVNYWPSETAMGWLRRYDKSSLREDFGRIAATGMDTVRIFLRWEDMQPTPAAIDAVALAAVIDTADAAADASLELIVTLFTGHMSGVNWIPVWATGGTDGDRRFRVVSDGRVLPDAKVLRNWYADPEIVDAQARLASVVGTALAGHPAVWAWDLGNENSNCTIPPDRAVADAWLERMTSVLRSCDPGALVTVGTHMEDLETERMIGPAEAARWCDFVCMHGYPIYADWAMGPTDEHLVPFLTEVTAWLAGGTPVLFEEFGHPTASPGRSPVGVQVAEVDAAAYAGRTLDAIRRAGGFGALLWCYTDYADELHASPPLDLAVHERTFGLWRVDRSPKPVVAEVIARRGRPCLPAPRARPWLDVTAEEFAADRKRQLARLYGRYVEHRPGSALSPSRPTSA